MRKIAVIGVAAATLALAGSAQASTSTSIKSYDNAEFGSTGFRVAFGQVFSSKDSCSANRKVKLIATKQGGKPKQLDAGATTADGAISGGFLESRVGNAKLEFVAPKTNKCGGASVQVKSAPLAARETRAPVNSVIVPFAVNGKQKNGAFAGLILLQSSTPKLQGSPKGMAPKCFANRKISLFGDGKLLDHGKTTHNGTWAQHVTATEFQNTVEFTAKLRKSKAPDGTNCGPDSTTFGGMTT